MINNFLIWFDVLKGVRPCRHFWQSLSNFSGENNLSSPWAKTYQKYAEDTYFYYGESEISYSEWLGSHFWTELNLEDLENI